MPSNDNIQSDSNHKSSPLGGVRGGFYRILSTLIFFTRLPFWRIANIDKKYYEHVVPLWPLVGWLTGGAMGLIAWLTFGLPVHVSVIMSLIVRVLITGALHEDGFADFCDGFGGGITRQRTLEIMKDSHIGTYGVLGLILYFFLMTSTVAAMETRLDNIFDIVATLLIADTFCKWCSSTIIYFLPYARKEAEAKNRLIYASVAFWEKVLSFILGILPACILIPLSNGLHIFPLAVSGIAAILTAAYLFSFMHRKIQGYTGDCCGATFIITEAVFYFVLTCSSI